MPERTGLPKRLTPMLRVCTAEGCTAIVFGEGTCVEHDPPAVVTMTTTLLNQAIARGREALPQQEAQEPS